MRKRTWKRMLSAILASAMILTMAPTNLAMTAQATESIVDEAADDAAAFLEEEQNVIPKAVEQETEDQDVQNPVGGVRT